MADFTTGIYAEIDDQFNTMSDAVDRFSGLPTVDPTPYETGAPIQPVGWVQNAPATGGAATVIIDASGIIINNGALTLNDQFGSNVITGAGFGASWLDFIASGFYNGNFAVGTTTDITASTLVGTASTTADYLASLSTDLPYWVVNTETGTGSFARVVDATAVGGFALKWNAIETAEIFQDIPIAPGQSYGIYLLWRYTNAASDFTMEIGYHYRTSSHAAIGAAGSQALLYSTSQATYTTQYVGGTGAVPANARYLRVFIKSIRSTGNPAVWVNSIAALPQQKYGSTLMGDANNVAQLFFEQPYVSNILDSRVTTDTYARFIIGGGGAFLWGGGGASSADIGLARGGAGVLSVYRTTPTGGSASISVEGDTSVQGYAAKRTTADTVASRFFAGINSVGTPVLEFGAGSAARDAVLYRGAANTLQTTDGIYASGGLKTMVKAGIPSDADLTGGMIASGVFVLDTTNSRIYFRVGSTWKYAALI